MLLLDSISFNYDSEDSLNISLVCDKYNHMHEFNLEVGLHLPRIKQYKVDEIPETINKAFEYFKNNEAANIPYPENWVREDNDVLLCPSCNETKEIQNE